MANALVAVVTALTLGGCYWMPQEAQPGSISLSLALPRGVVAPGIYADALRVTLYEAEDIGALYDHQTYSEPIYPTPSSPSDYIKVSQYGSPEALDGNDHYDVNLGEFYDPYMNPDGSFVIPGILPGKKYRIHVQLGQYDPAPDFYSLNYEGVSNPFEVVAGGVVDVALNLFISYNAY